MADDPKKEETPPDAVMNERFSSPMRLIIGSKVVYDPDAPDAEAPEEDDPSQAPDEEDEEEDEFDN